MQGSQPQAAVVDNAMYFFRDIVEPTVEEFMADRASKRRGCLACLALASMTEHFFHARPELAAVGKAPFKASLREENWSIGAILDVANATKHVIGDENRGKWGYRDVAPYQLNSFGIMRAGWPLGGDEVLVGPDRAWRLSDLIKCAMTFWRQKLGVEGGP